MNERTGKCGARGNLPLSFVTGEASILRHDSSLRLRRQFLFVLRELSTFHPAFVS